MPSNFLKIVIIREIFSDINIKVIIRLDFTIKTPQLHYG